MDLRRDPLQRYAVGRQARYTFESTMGNHSRPFTIAWKGWSPKRDSTVVSKCLFTQSFLRSKVARTNSKLFICFHSDNSPPHLVGNEMLSVLTHTMQICSDFDIANSS